LKDEDIVGQCDPFYAECRAYGQIERLKKGTKPRKRPLAVRCYGFLSIAAKEETILARRFGVTEWDRSDEEESLPISQQEPLRALVKELVTSDTEWTDRVIKWMIKDLKALNRIGIYIQDLSMDNYKGGFLVDFSASFTEPHFNFRRDIRQSWRIRQFKNSDLFEFDDMIKNLRIETSSKARRPEPERIESLRPRPWRKVKNPSKVRNAMGQG
jgi:Kinetochore Sim4 complex subunit FTA2